ncbi:hypothetical protein CsatA_014651 [Cannabis sativa]
MTPLEIPSLSPRKSRKRDRRNLDWMGDMVLKKSRYIKGQFNTIKEQAGLNMRELRIVYQRWSSLRLNQCKVHFLRH